MRILHALAISLLALSTVTAQSQNLADIHVNPNLRAPPLDQAAIDQIQLHSKDIQLSEIDAHLASLHTKPYVPMSNTVAISHTYESYKDLLTAHIDHQQFHVDAVNGMELDRLIEDCGCETPAPTECPCEYVAPTPAPTAAYEPCCECGECPTPPPSPPPTPAPTPAPECTCEEVVTQTPAPTVEYACPCEEAEQAATTPPSTQPRTPPPSTVAPTQYECPCEEIQTPAPTDAECGCPVETTTTTSSSSTSSSTSSSQTSFNQGTSAPSTSTSTIAYISSAQSVTASLLTVAVATIVYIL